VAAAHYVADNHTIRFRVELCRIKSLVNFDAKLTELRTHRRVNRAITSRYGETRRTSERRHAAHKGPANSKYVYVHLVSQGVAETAL
jgi:hypothetical protein